MFRHDLRNYKLSYTVVVSLKNVEINLTILQCSAEECLND